MWSRALKNTTKHLRYADNSEKVSTNVVVTSFVGFDRLLPRMAMER
jgi:hypothetical protein